MADFVSIKNSLVKSEISESSMVYYVGTEGNLENTKKRGTEFIRFKFTDRRFITNLTNQLATDDVVLLDLALSQEERYAFEEIGKNYIKEKDYSGELIYTPKILAEILAKTEEDGLNIKIIIISSVHGPKNEDDLKLFLSQEFRDRPNVKFMRTNDILNLLLSPASREKFQTIIA